jgi:hypothetical protein
MDLGKPGNTDLEHVIQPGLDRRHRFGHRGLGSLLARKMEAW